MQTPASATTPLHAAAVTIRPIHDPAELRACQDVQRRTWGITEDGYLIPVATLAAASAYGGLVLGAFDGARLVGFSFAFRGVLDGTPILYSQLTGVLPEAQGGGTGRRIKQWQREWAREQGLPLVAWAFDPLQAMNAHYNLVTLGAIATHYHPDFYGPRADALNPGLPTDRLLCVWSTADPLPPKPDPATVQGLNVVWSWPADFLPEIRKDRTVGMTPWMGTGIGGIGIEIPPDLNATRTQRSDVLKEWQTAIRWAFTKAFAEGYRAITFQRDEKHARYLLTKE